MERDYSSGTKDGVTYFTGFEVEKTPAFDMDTLFVVGCRPLEEVLEKATFHRSWTSPTSRVHLSMIQGSIGCNLQEFGGNGDRLEI